MKLLQKHRIIFGVRRQKKESFIEERNLYGRRFGSSERVAGQVLYISFHQAKAVSLPPHSKERSFSGKLSIPR
ncbi:MAG: hypothetical protein L0229_01975 [Blastocatellia bacterium]|nr:hypothetical protein [Blastocatellia bacterium]